MRTRSRWETLTRMDPDATPTAMRNAVCATRERTGLFDPSVLGLRSVVL
jgi:hypothetical protein